MIKSAFLSLVREKLDELATDLWTDQQLYDFGDEELRTLPAKRVYKQEVWDCQTAKDLNGNFVRDYPLPTGTIQVEDVQINESSIQDDYNPMVGWETFANVLTLPYRPTMVSNLRIKIQKSFTPLSSLTDGQSLDIPDSKVEVLVLGTVLRAYSKLMGYFVDLKNWDYNAKPDGISMTQVQSWIRDLKTEYSEILAAVRFMPKPRYINLTG